MGELKKDRRIDLKTFGQDLFINIASDEEKFLRDLKIYTKTGFKHHFNAFHELVDSPDKIKNLWKSINRINITEDELLILSERRKSAAIKQTRKHWLLILNRLFDDLNILINIFIINNDVHINYIWCCEISIFIINVNKSNCLYAYV